jgi:hypothetical protein
MSDKDYNINCMPSRKLIIAFHYTKIKQLNSKIRRKMDCLNKNKQKNLMLPRADKID